MCVYVCMQLQFARPQGCSARHLHTVNPLLLPSLPPQHSKNLICVCSTPLPPKKTRDVVDAQGWLHTGDVGMWLPGGRLKIIDR
jgi:acyl-CoA synthetase (AMP-forming)/AMP-acid ligase II